MDLSLTEVTEKHLKATLEIKKNEYIIQELQALSRIKPRKNEKVASWEDNKKLAS